MKRIILAVAVVLAGCSGTQTSPSTAPPPVAAAPAVAVPAPVIQPRQTHELLNAVLWTQTAVEHDGLSLQAYAVARDRLDAALNDPTWTAAIEQTGDFSRLPPAVILDLDETCVDNSPYEAEMIRQNRVFDRDLWRTWVQAAAAPALPGVVDFLRYADSKGVTPFYLTNRGSADRELTKQNLRALGFPLKDSPDNLMCPGDRPEWTGDKTSRRRAVAERYRILLLCGDDLGDFMAGNEAPVAERRAAAQKYADRWGRKWIVLPNPMYGSWERAIFSPISRDDEAAALKKKLEAVKSFR